MKKTLAIILALIVLLTAMFTACKKDENKDTGEKPTQAEGLEDAENEVGFETVEVTDENGEAVTDKSGEKVTTEVAVEYENKGNKTVAYVIDKNGNRLKDKNGNAVTVRTKYKKTTTKKSKKKSKTTKKSGSGQTVKPAKTTKATKTTTAKAGPQTTKKELTTNPKDSKVPKTSDSGPAVTFSSADQQTIKNMLEVPYLFKANYESANGVPINIASHAAIWMAEQDGLTMSTYASGTVVIDLFKYFGQTVVNFKSQCNSKGDCSNIKYNSQSDSFTISAFESKVQNVTIKEIQDLGGNNYYKVIGTVSGAGSKDKVVAVVQKNKLDSKLGFSIKALKWS